MKLRDNKFNGADSHTVKNRRKPHGRKSTPEQADTIAAT